MNMQRKMRWRAIGIAAGAAVLVALLGSTLTDLGAWYQNLREPSWKPPDAAFGLVWTVIFSLTALAGYLAWCAEPKESGRQLIVGMFSINGFLNICWSLVFFKLRRPDWALVEVGFLWFSILVLMFMVMRRSFSASLLLLPYLGWVGIAAALNYQVVVLNGPFA